MIITPKGWKEFQHYTKRKPSWIKLHRALLDDFEFSCLPVASRALAPMLWLLASEHKDGIIDTTLDKLAFRLRMTRGEVADALSPLTESGFFSASEPLADCKQSASLETERETEKEYCRVAKATPTKRTYSEDFEEKFWKPYPRTPTMSKLEAWRAWQKLSEEDHLHACQAISPYRQFLRSKPDLETVHACRFLSQRRFEGFAAPASSSAPVIDIRAHLV